MTPSFEGSNGLDVARGTTDHSLGLGTDSQGLAVFDVHGDHGGLVQDNPAPAHVDESVRGAQVDSHVTTQ